MRFIHQARGLRLSGGRPPALPKCRVRIICARATECTASMIENMLWTCGFVLACILFYRFALPALKRFDDANVHRIAVQETETADPQAHFRHAIDAADEQVEPVQEILAGTVRQYLFETEVYFTREEAE